MEVNIVRCIIIMKASCNTVALQQGLRLLFQSSPKTLLIYSITHRSSWAPS